MSEKEIYAVAEQMMEENKTLRHSHDALKAENEWLKLICDPVVKALDSVDKAIGKERKQVDHDKWESHAEFITRLKSSHASLTERVRVLEGALRELVNMIHEDMRQTGPFKITPSMAVKQALMGARAALGGGK